MEKAIRIERGRELPVPVSAFEIQKEFKGRNPWGVHFICPKCRQPLFPVAMSLNGKQSPHFRHVRNNPLAQECEDYFAVNGYASVYQHVPLPMFIRKSRSKDSEFIVEGGFRYLGADVIAQLEGESAVLHIGTRQYRINENNFGANFPKKTFEELDLRMEPLFKFENSSISLNETWGCPENARRAMVFTRDPYSHQGKRVKLGSPIPYETELYLLAPAIECSDIKKAFPSSKRVGFAGSRCQSKWFEVHTVTFSKSEENWSAGANYLKDCGFEIGKKEADLELVWPPALTSTGAAELLLKHSGCIVVTDRQQAADLHVVTASKQKESLRVKRPLFKPAADFQTSFATLPSPAGLCFITAKEWSEAGLAILSKGVGSSLQIDSNVPKPPTLEKSINGTQVVLTEIPCTITTMRHGGIDHLENKISNTDELSFTVDKNRCDLLRVTTKLRESKDDLVIVEKQFAKTVGKDRHDQKNGGRAALLTLQSSDFNRATNRRNRFSVSISLAKDKERALLRKGLK